MLYPCWWVRKKSEVLENGGTYQEKNEIIKLQNEVVISEIVFGMVHGRPYKGFETIPHVPIPITCHWSYIIIVLKCVY